MTQALRAATNESEAENEDAELTEDAGDGTLGVGAAWETFVPHLRQNF